MFSGRWRAPFARALAAAAVAATTAAAAQAAAQAPTQGAAGGAPNDLLGIYREALANDPTYGSARFARQAAGEAPAEARAGLRPNVSVGVGASETRFDSGNPQFGRSYWAWGPTLTAAMPLYRPQLGDAVDQADLIVRQGDLQLASARQDLILRVAQAYFDVLASQDALDALEANKKAVAENLAQAQREFQVGTKTIVDTHEAQARYDQIVAQQQVALGDLVVKKNALRAIIGHDPGLLQPLRDAPKLAAPEPADVEQWARRAETGNPQVGVAQAAADIARLSTRSARHAESPTVDLQAQAAAQRAQASSTSPFYNTVRQGVIGVQLNFPLYTGGLLQARIREALANEDKASQDLENARRSAGQGARQAYVGSSYGLSQVTALESAEVSARSQLDSTKLGYQVGVRTNLDVLNADGQLFNTQRDLKKARYDFLVNGLRLRASAGALAEEDVSAVNALLAH